MYSTELHDCDCGNGHGSSGAFVGLERTRFFSGQIVGPGDLTQDQINSRERMRRHNRLLHGWGVVCGLRVKGAKDPCQVVIEAGYALDPCGEEIVVPDEVTVDVCHEGMDGAALSACGEADPWCGEVRVTRDPEQTVYLAIRHAECQTRPVLAHADGCGCEEPVCEYSRIRDSFEVKVLEDLPESHTEMPDFGDLADALTCIRGRARECPECPADEWVVLADLKIGQDGQVDVKCFVHRRYAVSFARYAFQCARVVSQATTSSVASVLSYMSRSNTLMDESLVTEALEGEVEQPRASIAVRLPGAGLRTLPVHFEVERGETFGDLIAREGGRHFVADSGERFTLAEAYAVAGVDPAEKVEGVSDALRPLEGLELRVDDLRVVGEGLGEVVDDDGLARLEEAFAGAPERALDLPASAVKGVAADSPLGRKLADRSIADVAGEEREAFLAGVLRGTKREGREALERQAAAVWTNADRVRRLSEAWRER